MSVFSKRLLVVAALASVVFVAPAAVNADPVFVGAEIRLLDGPGGNGGGEYYADVTPTFGGPYTSAAGPYNFITFCMQRNEYLYGYGTTMYIGGITDHTVSALGPTYDDPISSATAYLYTSFRDGTLTRNGYDNAITNSTAHIASASALQLAFWYLEGELGRDSTTGVFLDPYNSNRAVFASNTLANSFITFAEGYAAAGFSGIGDVRVLNLYGDTGFTQHRQDQLVLSSVPEAGTMALLGVGLLGVSVAIRRRSA